MPAKNSIKLFVENGYYHLYNRGVEKRKIFQDQQDYAVFLRYIKKYLDPIEGSDPVKSLKSLSSEIELLAFCLMPNHFHFLVKQTSLDGITKFVRAVCTSYVMYFNKKYERIGTLFQGKYKGVLINNDVYLLHLSRYIHLNPLTLGSDPRSYDYSSYAYYLGAKKADWINRKEILDFFNTASATSMNSHFSYQNFVDTYKLDSRDILGNLALE